MAVLSPYAGRLSDRISPFRLAALGMAVCAAGLLIFAFADLDTSLWMILTPLALTGAGTALFSSPNTNAVMTCVEKKDYGVASSMLATMRSIGHTSSMVLVTAIVGYYVGSQTLTDAPPQVLIRAMHTVFFFLTGICAAGILLSLNRKFYH